MSEIQVKSIREALCSRTFQRLATLVLAAPALYFALSAVGISRWGSSWMSFFATYLGLLLLGSHLGIVLLPLWFFVRPQRADASAWWFVCLIATPLWQVSLYGTRFVRSEVFHRLAIRSAPVVEAIRSYEVSQGAPPDCLKQMVPNFLAEIPETGLGGERGYRYLVGEEAEVYEGNPWILFIDCPDGAFNFDRFFYFPLQNYPEGGFGGRFERMHDWAYHHE